ncbi:MULTISPECIES: RcnB family protein [unclassified Cobetia]|uniref:RcnB family protein n=1 Tax=unclassified Cobetia TaxID=2609414 RepID=UPI00209705FE|nr:MULTISPECIES: RcnB family protein [unclassified Cobetia]MCO7231514.1 RcnB family protein [Cobetia sp. Dlab-2-AX]MCO7235171.1 RcnB family protein [Cobetia sp. Dlab-2-U]
MRNRTLTVMMMIFTLMTASLAQASPNDRDDHGGQHNSQGNQHNSHGNGHQKKKQQTRHDQSQRHHQQKHQAQARHQGQKSHNWRRGDHVPRSYYANKRYWVSDWRAHKLSAPPQGHRWLNIDGRYVLAAVAGGAITAIILNH